MLVLPFYISLVLFTLPCPDAFYDLHPLPALIPKSAHSTHSFFFFFYLVPLIPSNPLSFPTNLLSFLILPYPWVLFRTLKFLQERIIDKVFTLDHSSDHDSYIPIKDPFHQFSCPLHHSGGLELSMH